MRLGNCLCIARELVAHPDIFQDQVVLELGSGTGLVGLVAALAGAQQVGAVL
jgi:predicted nicotinamide N-methyase